ncbi:MAG: glycosyltransferase family 4 protein [Defluviicoccus sp.]
MSRPQFHVLLPGPAATVSGGFLYDRRMIVALKGAGWLASLITLPDCFPFPPADVVARAEEGLAALADGSWLIVDGLALAPLYERIAALQDGRLRVVALIHHPLCDEGGLSAPERAHLFASERRALATARHVIVSSVTTAHRLADFGVAAERIAIVPPGITRAVGAGARRRHDHTFGVRLLSVGSLVPRKGHDVLMQALARLRRLSWRLTLVGPERDRRFTRRLRTLSRCLGLGARVRFAGSVRPGALEQCYRDADVFVLPSRMEGYGIALAEAMAHGLPIVTTPAGAIPEVVPATAGVFVPPGAVKPLADALAMLIRDRGRRGRLRRGALKAPAARRTWATAEAEFLATLAGVAPQ